MRQGQQNRRGRGRNNHNGGSNNNNNNGNGNQHRKSGQNPLSRSYESTGPDTKIRGTPAHIAEKYMQLARDALTSGDPVLAENYLQHAEHYNRIIMTYREQQVQNGESVPQQGQIGRFRPAGMSDEEFAEEEAADEFGGGSQPPRQGDPQPRFDSNPRYDDRPQRQQPPRDRGERNFNDRGGEPRERFDRQDRGERQDRPPERQERPDRPERQDRAERPERSADRADRPERVDRPERTVERGDRPERAERPERAAQLSDAGDAAPRRRERTERAPIPAHEQPEFLRRPVRRPRREAASEDDAETPSTPVVVDGE